MSTARPEGTVRERLLAAANELFYAEGVHTVGIDRVIERAGVAKASLYAAFGSKDELIREYLRGRAAVRKERILAQMSRHEKPRDRILALYDLLGEVAQNPSYRGCAFVNASAEGARKESAGVREVVSELRGWLRDLLVGLAREVGAADPDELGRQLVLLYDGTAVGAAMDRSPAVALRARAVAEVLLDAAVRPRRKGAR